MCTGEGTLEAQLVRLQLRSMVETDGLFDFDNFLQKYITFMTTPGSHNDTYAGVSGVLLILRTLWALKERIL